MKHHLIFLACIFYSPQATISPTIYQLMLSWIIHMKNHVGCSNSHLPPSLWRSRKKASARGEYQERWPSPRPSGTRPCALSRATPAAPSSAPGECSSHAPFPSYTALREVETLNPRTEDAIAMFFRLICKIYTTFKTLQLQPSLVFSWRVPLKQRSFTAEKDIDVLDARNSEFYRLQMTILTSSAFSDSCSIQMIAWSDVMLQERTMCSNRPSTGTAVLTRGCILLHLRIGWRNHRHLITISRRANLCGY